MAGILDKIKGMFGGKKAEADPTAAATADPTAAPAADAGESKMDEIKDKVEDIVEKVSDKVEDLLPGNKDEEATEPDAG